MRAARTTLLLLLLLLPAAPARAAIQFLGHDPVGAGCIARNDWSSDLGPDYVASRPIGGLTSGFTLLCDTSRVLAGGTVRAVTQLQVAPAGPADASAPVFVFEGRAMSANAGDGYGRTATNQHTGCLRFTPPGSGSTVYWAVRWMTTGASSGAATRQTVLRTSVETLVFGAAPANGTAFGTLPGHASSLCGLEIEHVIEVGSGGVGTGDETFRVELYLDSAPLVGVGTDPGRGLALSAPAPNPALGRARFALRLASGEPAGLRIADVTGRTVRDLAVGAGAAGPASLEWDGRDAAGRACPPGVYLARLRQSGSGVSRRFVLAR